MEFILATAAVLGTASAAAKYWSGWKSTRITFGKALSDFTPEQTNDQGIPYIFGHLVSKIEAIGLREEGIFRLSGSSTNVNRLREAYDSKEAWQIDLKTEKIEDIAVLFKLYIRMIPGFIPQDLYSSFIEAQAIKDQDIKIEKFKQVLSQLPSVNRLMFHRILSLLALISSHSHINKMTVRNLSISLGPSIFSGLPPDSLSLLDKHHYQEQLNAVLATLIENYLLVLGEEKSRMSFVPVDDYSYSLLGTRTFSENDQDNNNFDGDNNNYSMTASIVI